MINCDVITNENTKGHNHILPRISDNGYRFKIKNILLLNVFNYQTYIDKT